MEEYKYNQSVTLNANVNRNLKEERKQNFKVKEKIQKLQPNDYILGKPFNLVKTEYAWLATGITAVPPAVMLVLGMAGGAAALFTGFVIAMNSGMPLNEAEQQVMRTLENFMLSSGKFTENAFSLLAKTVVLPLSMGTVCIAKEMVEQLKTNKREELEERAEIIKEIIRMLRDIKLDKKDHSLDFPKEFLANVDLKSNNHYFNFLLLNRLANYRCAVEDEINGKLERNSSLYEFDEFMYLIENDIKGASRKFYKDPFIKELIAMNEERKKEESKHK